MLCVFTNRRRAKDSIMLMVDWYGVSNMTVFVRESLVYVDVNDSISATDLDLIMHYAERCQGGIENFLELDNIEELYKGVGIRKFRV